MKNYFQIILNQKYFSEHLKEALYETFTEEGMKGVFNYLGYENIGEHGDNLQIIINDNPLLDQEYAHCCYCYLTEFNRGLYDFITTDKTLIRLQFDRRTYPDGTYLDMNKKGDKLQFLRNSFFPNLSSEYIDLKLIIEEVVKITKEYREIFRKLAEGISPNLIEDFMQAIFYEPDWPNLEEEWNRKKIT